MNNAPNTGQSEQWFARALETLPGGVSSPVRASQILTCRPAAVTNLCLTRKHAKLSVDRREIPKCSALATGQ